MAAMEKIWKLGPSGEEWARARMGLEPVSCTFFSRDEEDVNDDSLYYAINIFSTGNIDQHCPPKKNIFSTAGYT